MDQQTGILLIGHGSRDEAAIAEFGALARRVAARIPDFAIDHAFLEFAKPVIRDGLAALRRRGVQRILAIPGMLFAAGHVKNDVPSVLNTYMAQHPGIEVRYGRDLGIDPRMLRAAAERIRRALEGASGDTPAHETMLVVVGRGTSDSDANSNVAKVMRLLWEGFGFGWGETLYSGVTFPLVEPGLEQVVRLGFRRIVVFPYFLFTGILVRRIYAHTDRVAARHPHIEFLKAPYLNDHPLVVDTVIDRAREMLDGSPNMNCQMCKYREQILGFEGEVGLAQASHHHHVEGIGTGPVEDGAASGDDHAGHPHHHQLDHDHHHDHHDHDGDDHHHRHGDGHAGGHAHRHPYPHADHPLGPVSLKRTRSR